MKKAILAIVICGTVLLALLLYSADRQALSLASFSVDDARVVVSQARSWEHTRPVYYRAKSKGKALHGEFLIGVRRRPMPPLSFSILTDASSNIIALVESTNPRTVLALVDQRDSFSWPHDESKTATLKVQEKTKALGLNGLRIASQSVPEVLGEKKE